MGLNRRPQVSFNASEHKKKGSDLFRKGERTGLNKRIPQYFVTL